MATAPLLLLASATPLLAWTKWDESPFPRARTYAVDPSLCAAVLPRFRDDWLLPARMRGCRDVRATVRGAFDAWQHNADVSFREVDWTATAANSSSPPELTVNADLPTSWDDDTLAMAAPRDLVRGVVHIAVSPDHCWYADRAFCASVARRQTVWHAGLAAACFLLPSADLLQRLEPP